MPKPSSSIDWTATNPTVRTEPSGSKKEEGWGIDEPPAREFMNWVFYNIWLWLEYFESITDATPVQTQTINYAAVAADKVILMDATGGARVVTLPAAASSVGALLTIKKIDSSANTVTLDGNASEAIDGALTQVLTNQYESMQIICANGGWHIL